MKKFWIVLFAMFLIAQIPTAASESKNLLGLTKVSFRAGFIEKFGREPKVEFKWNDTGFCANHDAELWIDTMVLTLEALPAEKPTEFFLFTREAFFIYGIAFTLVIGAVF